MSQKFPPSHSRTNRPLIYSPFCVRQRRLSLSQALLLLFLSVLLCAEVLANWSFLVKPVYAQSIAPLANGKPSLTFQQFMKEGRLDRFYHGRLIPQKQPPSYGGPAPHYANRQQLPPGAEPPTMKPLSLALSSAYFTAGSSGTPVDLKGSDSRLEVLIAPGSFDLSHATVSTGGAPQGTLTLRLTQLTGHFVGMFVQFGTYQLQLIDAQGHVVNGIQLRTPITFVYHYAPDEPASYGVDPGHLFLTWPVVLESATKSHPAPAGASVPMVNDPVHHTLTAKTNIIDSNIVNIGVGDPSNQSPPPLHLASMQGNNGQLSYSYPISVAPGPGGYAPQLALQYSGAGPNERHSLTSPAGDEGDGWNLSLGSISTETVGGTTWYFLNDVGGVGDRLIPQGSNNLYDTQHISYLKIQLVNPGSNQCFHVWDKSGTYYEVGCTSDSLEYRTDSGGGQHNYLWQVNKIVAPNEGANAGTYRVTFITYLQDSYTFKGNNNTTYTTIRDSGIKQIIYGTSPSPNTSPTSIAGIIDFHYKAPTAQGSWADPYNTNYNCTGTPPDGTSTTLRCDDPIQKSGSGTFTPPNTFASLSLMYLTSYVGDDSTLNHAAYRYDFTYSDTVYYNCTDPASGQPGYCAGDHVLMSVTPTVYQSGTAHQLKGTIFGYTDPTDTNTNDTYFDGQDKVGGSAYQVTTKWKYLNSIFDNDTGVGQHISYYVAYNNSHGTPTDTDTKGNIIDNRYDPFYCPNHKNSQASLQCTGYYANPDERAWSEQVVTQITSWGKDSSDTNLSPANIQYSYRLIKTGTWDGKTTWCYPDQTQADTDCVGDNWEPSGDSTWQDYFHAEYQGFAQVYITSPAQDLTVDTYYSTEGWYTPWSHPANFLGGSLKQEDVYAGKNATSSVELRSTIYNYAANSNACRSTSATYPACEVVLNSMQTYDFEQTGVSISIAPSTTTSYTYDDYSNSSGLAAVGTKVYHNLTQEQISGTNLPSSIYPLTEQWNYAINDQVTSGSPSWTYYTVNKVSHSEIDDKSGRKWQCQYTTYDEGSGVGSVSAGWPTTVKTYASSNCSGQTSPLTTNYTDYDVNGNVVATVDPDGAATPSLYSGKGCTVSSGTIAIASSAWTAGRYTACSAYDSAHFYAVPVSATNAFGQTTSYAYDTSQGDALTSVTNPNSQQTSYSYSYDGSGNRTVQSQLPLHHGSYTKKSITNSNCSSSSTLPCFEIDTISYQYNTVTSRTFYDSQGRAVETRTPGPTNGYDTIVFTTYNDQTHSVFQSQPFVVTSGSGWVDPNGAVDYQNLPPGGTATFYDALGRVIAVQDALYKTDGISCSTSLTQGIFTACTNYSLGQVSGDSNYYDMATSIDANKHVAVSYLDILGRTVYTFYDSGLYGGTLTPNEKKTFQYNVLNEPTSVVVTDLAPQSGQSITSVTTTASYDDLGRLTQLIDPDRGTHNYSYDPDGRLIQDTSGSRTIGTVYDLLGRVGCVEDAVPSYSPTGACTSGAHPYVQNTYDTNTLTVSGTTDYPIGQLTQSVATTYFPDGTTATTTESFEHDARGRLLAEQLQITGLPSGWNVTTALPSYLAQYTYNDADQLTQLQTSTNPSGQGYTIVNQYDSTTGALTGLGNGSNTLATLTYNTRALTGAINFRTTAGGPLAIDQFGYDGDLRLLSIQATWQSGSGNSGNILSQSLTYDSVGNLINLSTTQAAVPGQTGSGGSETQNFCYDEQNRLVWAGNSGTQPSAGNGTCGSGTLSNTLNGASYSNTFVYTHLGQLWQGPLNGGSTQYQYLYCNSQPHELAGLYAIGSTCSSKSGQGYASSYDAWGNVTSRSYSGTTATLSYDLLDHLTQWYASSTNQEQYLYDASGERVLRRVTNGSGSTMIVYPFGLEEHQYSGSGANQWNTYYYSLGGRLIGALDGNGTTFYLTDALGSILASFNNAAGGASIKGNQVFGPYGNGRYYQGNINTGKGFTGQYHDATGLDYFNARYYDPVAGVFLSADTMQGNLEGLNPYAYVNGNPETASDPSGRMLTWHGGAGGGVSGTVPPPPPPPAPACSGWWDCAWHTVTSIGSTVIHTVASVTVSALDTVTGFSSMVNDVGTIFSSKTSLWQKVLAGADLLFNGVMDVSMIMGVGEMFRGAEILFKGGMSLLEHGGENILEHEGENILEHEGESLLEHGGEGLGGACSFTSATLVATARGEQAIGSLHVGEKVWAYNPKTHRMELEPILHVWINHDNDLVDLTLTTTKTDAHGKHSSTTSEVIHTNQKHPFLTKEKGFLPVGQIKLGMHVLEANGQYGVVTGWKVVPGTKVMYNLEVAHDHTFTVGGEQWVVHNDCGSLPEQAEARAREIGANIDAQVGKWNRSALTVATAIVDDGGEVRTLIATNEKASSSLVKLVTAQLKEGETFISLAEKQGRHAEQVLYSYIQDKGLKVLGFGASNDFCDEMCRPMLQQGLGPDVLGQP